MRVLNWLKYYIGFWFVFPIAAFVWWLANSLGTTEGIAIVSMTAAVLVWWIISIGIELYLRERDE